MDDYPPALQQTLTRQFAATAPGDVPPEALGMVPDTEIPPEMMPMIEQLAQQMGMTAEDLVARLVATARELGISVMELLQQIMQRAQAGGGAPNS